MHSAPVVRYPVERSRHVAWAVAVLWLVAAALSGWWYAAGAEGWRLAAALACLLGAGAAAVLLLRANPQGSLRWDGHAWWWQAGEVDMQVTVTLCADLQDVLLLHIAGRRGLDPWCCVERAALPRAWGDLRCALHATARSSRAPASSRDAAT